MTRRFAPVLVLSAWLKVVALTDCPAPAVAAAPQAIPHGQSRPPGDPVPPAAAAKAMTVPEGFTVEVVASEPEIVNPVALTFDERGRAWITESLEYPRRSPGPGRDRIKILEDTDSDGRADRFTVFADDLNIPSGIAVGHGGVWVENAPDLLFLQDTDGDGKADRREVVVTGFGRSDTHELPNSLSWGPDGWLYGWNGVFNPSHVTHRGKTFDFTCAIFRVHPKTRAFELFCEGTSNPWGLDWDAEGSAFASACVIDHLWHLTETGYYHRQGGPYPPFTWEIGSIVGHRHQQAAYCGLHFYDSDVYPDRYRGKLFMGNIHGNGLNVDRLRRNGSTYAADAEPDFLAAHDPWFMPVAVKTGPDGCLYVLDWYDRYHCYQDANRDPQGIDRLKGRLYRVRYQDAPRRSGFDLARESDPDLVNRLNNPRGYDRETARRLLAERAGAATDSLLSVTALNRSLPRSLRLNALWARISRANAEPEFLRALLDDPDPTFRAWGVRTAGDLRASGNPNRLDPGFLDKLRALAHDASPDVQLQVAIASRKVEGVEPVALLAEVASACGDDPLIPRIVWQNLHPLLGTEANAAQFLRLVTPETLGRSPALVAMAPRVIDRLLAAPDPTAAPLLGLIVALAQVGTPAATDAARQAIGRIAARVQTGELSGASLDRLRDQFGAVSRSLRGRDAEDPLNLEFTLLATSLKRQDAYAAARAAFLSTRLGEGSRVDALRALIGAGDPGVLESVARLFSEPGAASVQFRGQVLAALGRVDDPAVASVVIGNYPRMEPELRPQAVELLSQREAWHPPLVRAVERGVIPSGDLNVNQIRKLLASRDAALAGRVRSVWGAVRAQRDPNRERVILRVREALRQTPGDPAAGAAVFRKVCAQCHKIYGEGQDVGPEITLNGRGSYDQLLSNVFDPSLVIGAAYQATTVAAADGRVLTGLLVEDSPRRVVLKLQGGKTETLPKDQVEEMKLSPLSLMPEDLDKQLKPQEIADLFAFLTLDKPPGAPDARPIPGARDLHTRPRPPLMLSAALIYGPSDVIPSRRLKAE